MKTPSPQNSQSSAARAVLPKSVWRGGMADLDNRGLVHNLNLRTHHNQIVKAFLAWVRGRGFQLKGPPL
jgi:hypothetical protein